MKVLSVQKKHSKLKGKAILLEDAVYDQLSQKTLRTVIGGDPGDYDFYRQRLTGKWLINTGTLHLVDDNEFTRKYEVIGKTAPESQLEKKPTVKSKKNKKS